MEGTLTDAGTLRPGDVLLTDEYGSIAEGAVLNVRNTILRDRAPYRDRFGREMFRYWARREDTGAEGWMTYGPGAMVRRAR